MGDTPAHGSVADSSSKKVDPCSLVTAAELSSAAGTTYTGITPDTVTRFCAVTGSSKNDSFSFSVQKEDSALNSWTSTLSTIQQDDGSYKSVSGIGDKAVEGAVKEFAAESNGHIVTIVAADLGNDSSNGSMPRSEKIAKLLIGKL